MSPEREPMENDSNSRTAEELEQQTVDVYVERALHGPVFRMSYEHTHTYCEIFYLKSGTCTYTVNQGQWHLEAGDLFIVAAIIFFFIWCSPSCQAVERRLGKR